MFFYPEKEEKKKWKDLKLMKKLERQRAQEEQAKRQEDEEAAAEKEDRGELGSWGGPQVVAHSSCPGGRADLEGPLQTSRSKHLVLMEKLRPREGREPTNQVLTSCLGKFQAYGR